MTLHGMLDATYKDYHNTITLQYCYHSNHEGEDWIIYYFNDPECYYREWDCPNIEYSEFPDDIWERIQKILYNKATKDINENLRLAKSSVTYWENRKDEFDNKLQLKL